MAGQGASRETWYEIGTWYECIEEPVREIVKLLRNNGFNTFSSCGHARIVEMEWYKDHDVTRLRDLLFEHGYRHFVIDAHWDTFPSTYPIRRILTLTLGSKDRGEERNGD